jgi:environmental stress-induced protein Ves
VQAWKNGGGVTREIAVFPDGAGSDDFIWRISVADVTAGGPFSVFPGIDRYIAVIDGKGMTLTRTRTAAPAAISAATYAAQDNAAPHTRSPVTALSDSHTVACWETFEFSGEDAIDCQLTGGAIRDFNLMVRASTAQGALRVCRGSDAREHAGNVSDTHAVSGPASYTASTPGVHTLRSESDVTLLYCAAGALDIRDIRLLPGDSALYEGAIVEEIRAAGADTVWLDARIVLLS